jgi:hypothetical protein
VGRTACRLTAEKDKQKKDVEKARARERMRAREALEKRRQRQERDGLPLEPSPDTPDDDDDDEDDDMATRLGLSLDPRLGQGSSSQPLGGLTPPVFGAGMSGSRSEERRRAEGVLDPLAEIIVVTPGGQADPYAPREQVPVPAVREVVPSAVVTSPGRPPPRRLGRPRRRRRRSRPLANPRQRLRRPGSERSPRRHDWPCPGAGKYLRAPLFQPFFYVS